MSTAYLDSSYAVAILLKESEANRLEQRVGAFDTLVSANLLEGEVRSTMLRERLALPADALARVRWIFPDRALTPEIERVLSAGYLRGADAWHLACALYFFESPTGATFLTLDEPQRSVAEALGFQV